MKACENYEERISEMLLGEIPAEEQQQLHLHMSNCEGCMEFYISLYETLEVDEKMDFSLTDEQREEIFDHAREMSPSKKVIPWNIIFSVAAALVVSFTILAVNTESPDVSLDKHAEKTNYKALESIEYETSKKTRKPASTPSENGLLEPKKSGSFSRKYDYANKKQADQQRNEPGNKLKIVNNVDADPMIVDQIELSSEPVREFTGSSTNYVKAPKVQKGKSIPGAVTDKPADSEGEIALKDVTDENKRLDNFEDKIGKSRLAEDFKEEAESLDKIGAVKIDEMKRESQLYFNNENSSERDNGLQTETEKTVKSFNRVHAITASGEIAAGGAGPDKEREAGKKQMNLEDEEEGQRGIAYDDSKDKFRQRFRLSFAEKQNEEEKKNKGDKDRSVENLKSQIEGIQGKLEQRLDMLLAQTQPVSTFSIDVDTASYQLAKQAIQSGRQVDPLTIRAEEFINYFEYDYAAPKDKAFAVDYEVANSPFHRSSQILRIGVQGKRPGGDHRAASHFCFIVDTSGSMAESNRLPMVQKVLPMIIKQMSVGDRVSLISCGLQSRLELDRVDVRQLELINQRISSLNAVGATNLEASLIDGYNHVLRNVRRGTYNRVVLFSDGVANLGEQNADTILKKLTAAKEKGVGITVIGMGKEEYNDNFLETLADKGDGNYVFIGDNREARKTFEEKFAATFHTIAYNVKIQVEFDPSQVSRYRLLGYENRRLQNKNFRNDKVDAGEVGSGQSVTALYELELTGRPSANPIAEIRLRYRDAVDNQMHEFATPVLQKTYNVDFQKSSAATRLALISGKFAEVLRAGGNSEGITKNELLKQLRPLAVQMNNAEVIELLKLIEKSR